VPGEDPLRRLVGFGRYLRRQGLAVGTGRVLAFCRAASVLDATDPIDLHLAARATLVSRPEDHELLDAAFRRWFHLEVDEELSVPASPPDGRRDDDGSEEDLGVVASLLWATAGEDPEDDEEGAIPVVASEVELLRRKDFGELTEDERRVALARVRRLTFPAPRRPSRRHRPSSDGRRFDLRRTLRRSLRTEGEPFERAWRRRRTRRRPLVLILDVSGSMAPYSRPLVEFAHAAASAGGRVEAFCFGTRLTRITRQLKSRDPEVALQAVARAVVDWDGGTRIGESLKELLDEWSARSALRGSIVVFVSDGLERGDPQVLEAQMARLGRLAYRVLWLNPLKGSPRYEPLARGMAASLPYIDVFLPGHNLESLEELCEALTLV
jgi:uncharacterized protein with von Willebrand factor type A (vWA) domain